MKKIHITSPPIKLSSFLKFIGESCTGGGTKKLIYDEKVSVNNKICTERGKKITIGDVVKVENREYEVISNESNKTFPE